MGFYTDTICRAWTAAVGFARKHNYGFEVALVISGTVCSGWLALVFAQPTDPPWLEVVGASLAGGFGSILLIFSFVFFRSLAAAPRRMFDEERAKAEAAEGEAQRLYDRLAPPDEYVEAARTMQEATFVVGTASFDGLWILRQLGAHGKEMTITSVADIALGKARLAVNESTRAAIGTEFTEAWTGIPARYIAHSQNDKHGLPRLAISHEGVRLLLWAEISPSAFLWDAPPGPRKLK